MGKRMTHLGMFTRRMNVPKLSTFAATLLIYHVVSLNGSGAKSIITDCCSEINITSSGDALEKQGIRFGKYIKIAENDDGHFIYQYQNVTDKSTLMPDKRGEWKVYNGGSRKPKVDRQVIKSGCDERCVSSCTNHTFKYLDGDNFILDKTIKINCVIPEGLEHWWSGLLIGLGVLAIVLTAIIWYIRTKTEYCKVDGKAKDAERADESILFPLTDKTNSELPENVIETSVKVAEYFINEEIIPNSVVSKCVEAKKGVPLFSNSNLEICTLPEFLEGSHLFALPYKQYPAKTVISIETHEPSTIYVVYSETNGWIEGTLLGDGFVNKYGFITAKDPQDPENFNLRYFSHIWHKTTTNSANQIILPPTQPSCYHKAAISVFISKEKAVQHLEIIPKEASVTILPNNILPKVTANVGEEIWSNRPTKITKLPSCLQGETLYRLNCGEIKEGTTIEILAADSCIVYVAHTRFECGWPKSTLPELDFVNVGDDKDNFIDTEQNAISFIWGKTAIAGQKILLPPTEIELRGAIFISIGVQVMQFNADKTIKEIFQSTIKAKNGMQPWRENESTIRELPQCLINSDFYQLPCKIPKQESTFKIDGKGIFDVFILIPSNGTGGWDPNLPSLLNGFLDTDKKVTIGEIEFSIMNRTKSNRFQTIYIPKFTSSTTEVGEVLIFVKKVTVEDISTAAENIKGQNKLWVPLDK